MTASHAFLRAAEQAEASDDVFYARSGHCLRAAGVAVCTVDVSKASDDVSKASADGLKASDDEFLQADGRIKARSDEGEALADVVDGRSFEPASADDGFVRDTFDLRRRL